MRPNMPPGPPDDRDMPDEHEQRRQREPLGVLRQLEQQRRGMQP